MGQAKDDSTRQLRRLSSVLSPYSSKSREIRGGCPDVRMGVSKGKDVAVKSLRVSGVDDKSKIRKVGKQVTLSHPGSLIHRTAFLQRSGPVEAPVSSKRPQSHWGP